MEIKIEFTEKMAPQIGEESNESTLSRYTTKYTKNILMGVRKTFTPGTHLTVGASVATLKDLENYQEEIMRCLYRTSSLRTLLKWKGYQGSTEAITTPNLP